MEEEEKQRQLFGSLFGFKKGDRVKVQVRRYPRDWWNPKRKSYLDWQYGTVKDELSNINWRVRDDPHGDRWFKVEFHGGGYSWNKWHGIYPARQLTKVRKYERKNKEL